MDVSSAQLSSMATGADDAVSLVMLRKALDQSAGAMAQLLQGLPPLKSGAGTVFDGYA